VEQDEDNIDMSGGVDVVVGIDVANESSARNWMHERK